MRKRGSLEERVFIVDGSFHRADGPAIVGKHNLWYWRDELFDPDEFREWWPDDKKAWWMRARLNNP